MVIGAVRDTSRDSGVMDEGERDVRADQLQESVEVANTQQLLWREMLKRLLTTIHERSAIVATRDDGQIVLPKNVNALLDSTENESQRRRSREGERLLEIDRAVLPGVLWFLCVDLFHQLIKKNGQIGRHCKRRSSKSEKKKRPGLRT
jgi:hypothetical protein